MSRGGGLWVSLASHGCPECIWYSMCRCWKDTMGMETTLSVGIQFCLMRTCLMRRSLLLFSIEKFASWGQETLHPSRCNGRIDPLKKPLGRRRRICEKNTHICLQIQVLLFVLVFLLVIVRGRTMGKLVSIVTTCLVVLSSRFYFWKNRLRRRTPRRTVMGTTDRRRVSFQNT